ncbi:MAG TPA: hypothetical protein DCM86_05870 [Verrucomicrobiales bacterium]|nr:hypothetical protein [Verrucomicrobiales bacterium]
MGCGVRQLFSPPSLTRRRIVAGYAVAVAADALQLLLGPLGWAFIDEGIDLVAMVLLTLTLGFHPLLLPTFIVEFIPVVDMLPTWTGCVAMVLAFRRRTPSSPLPTPPDSPPSGPVIDV